MEVKIFDALPPEAIQIRTRVFVEEQGFRNEFDGTDDRAKHLVVFDDQTAVATCRIFEQKSRQYIVGRIAVVKQYRGKKIGAGLLRAAEDIVRENRGQSISLHAQVAAKKFYEKQGYVSCGKTDYDENCPHIWMQKKIGE